MTGPATQHEGSLQTEGAEAPSLLSFTQLSPGMRCSHSLWVVYGMKEPERDAVKVKVTQSCPSLCNPMTIQYMEFSRPEYWSG